MLRAVHINLADFLGEEGKDIRQRCLERKCSSAKHRHLSHIHVAFDTRVKAAMSHTDSRDAKVDSSKYAKDRPKEEKLPLEPKKPIRTPEDLADELKRNGMFDRLRKEMLRDFLRSVSAPSACSTVMLAGLTIDDQTNRVVAMTF